MVKGLENEVTKRTEFNPTKQIISYNLGHNVDNPGYSIPEINELPEYSGSANSSDFEYSFKRGAAYKIAKPETVFGKIKKRVQKMASILAFISVVGMAGCDPLIVPNPGNPTEQPANVTDEPPADPTPVPKNYVDISGQVKNGETLSGELALVQIYNNTDNSLLGQYSTNSSGNFSITLDKTIEELPDGVSLETRLSDSDWENGTSYITTEEFSQGDHSDIVMYPTPFYSDFDNDGWADLDRNQDGVIDQQEKEAFRDFAERSNYTDNGINPLPEPGSRYVKKWAHNLGLPEDFQGVQISANDYTPTEYETIKAVILEDMNEVNVTYGNEHYHQKGWGFVKKSELGNGSECEIWDTNSNGYIDWFTTSLNTSATEILNHEIVWHGIMGCPGETNGPDIPEIYASIGRWQSPYPEHRTAQDTKLYKHLKKSSGKENINNGLGL